jgi:hypothetical protein
LITRALGASEREIFFSGSMNGQVVAGSTENSAICHRSDRPNTQLTKEKREKTVTGVCPMRKHLFRAAAMLAQRRPGAAEREIGENENSAKKKVKIFSESKGDKLSAGKGIGFLLLPRTQWRPTNAFPLIGFRGLPLRFPRPTPKEVHAILPFDHLRIFSVTSRLSSPFEGVRPCRSRNVLIGGDGCTALSSHGSPLDG